MKKLFLDIEGTLIDDLNNPLFLDSNIDKIRRLIPLYDEVSIFSFAIYDSTDKELYKSTLNALFKELKITNVEFLYKNDLLPVFKEHFGNNLSLIDFNCDICISKELAFYLYSKTISDKYEKITLIDDRVSTQVILFNSCMVKMININEM